MAEVATNYQQNVHQIGNTVAWSIILNIGIVCGALRFDRVAAAAHLTFGIIIMVMTYVFVFYLISPYGFNANIVGGWWFYAHGIIGCMLIGFVTLQVAGGLLAKFGQQRKSMSLSKLKYVRNLHKVFGYFLALLYKINIIWAWYGTPFFFQALIVWDGLWIIAYILIKTLLPRLQKKIQDPQTEIGCICPEIGRISEVEKLTENYVIFGNYVYDARELEKNHPGGFKVIEDVKGREVDRFLYGMYSTQLSPQIGAFDHPSSSMELVGPPIAKIVTPSTFEGFLSEVVQAKIQYINEISSKTQIYALGITQKSIPLKYVGYSDLRQLGQFYSLTYGKTTRLYTAVNFLTKTNMKIMMDLIQTSRQSIFRKAQQHQEKLRESELVEIVNKDSNLLTQKLQIQREEGEDYLPLMMKVYDNGKMTSQLKKGQFLNLTVKLSIPRGKGLQLEKTPPGRIVALIGGTGLFPFSDLIDLLFKAQLIENNHSLSQTFLNNDPILKKKPFNKYFFVLLIAINEPEDIHPITLSQLISLSEQSKRVKIVMRISKNHEKLSRKIDSIQFTREYFNKRVLTQAAESDISKIWICGPPKLNSDIGKILLENGLSRSLFLFL